MKKETGRYILDFSKVKYFLEFYQLIKDGLDFPDYFGMNLDALWDSLTGHLHTPCIIVIKNLSKLGKSKQKEFASMKKVFLEAEEKFPDEFEIIFENDTDYSEIF